MVTVPNDCIGKVIGPGGSGLRHLWRLAHVKANVPREALENGDRQIQLTGTPEQVQRAQHILLQMIAQQGPTMGQAGAPMGSPGPPSLLPPAHPHSTALPLGSLRLLLEPGRAGHLVGKAGSGLRELREESGAQFELARADWLGGRLLTIRPPVTSQLRCIDLLCRKLGVAVDGSPCPVHLRVLLSSDVVGSVVGRSGGGLKALRETGIALELPREEAVPGWRLLSLSGPGQSIAAAASAVCAKLAEACGMGVQSPMGGAFLPPPKPHYGSMPGGPPSPHHHGLPSLNGQALSLDGRPMHPHLSQPLGGHLGLAPHPMLQPMLPAQMGGMHHFYPDNGHPTHGGPGCVGLAIGAESCWIEGGTEMHIEMGEPVEGASSASGGMAAGPVPGGAIPGGPIPGGSIPDPIPPQELHDRRVSDGSHGDARASGDVSSRDSGVSHGGRDSAVSTVSHPRISTSWA
jgi:hypothetical protein